MRRCFGDLHCYTAHHTAHTFVWVVVCCLVIAGAAAVVAVKWVRR